MNLQQSDSPLQISELRTQICQRNYQVVINDYDSLVNMRKIWTRLYNLCLYIEAFALCFALITLSIGYAQMALIFISVQMGVQRFILHATKEENTITHKLSSYNKDLNIDFAFETLTYGDVESNSLSKKQSPKLPQVINKHHNTGT